MGKFSGVIFVLLERTSASRFSIRFRVSAAPEGYSVRILLNCFRAPAQSPASSRSSADFNAIANRSVGGGAEGVTTGVGTGVGVSGSVAVGVGVNCLGVIGAGVGVMCRGVITGVGFGVTSATLGPWKLLIVCHTKNPPTPSSSRTKTTSPRINTKPKTEIFDRFCGGAVGGWDGSGGGATVAPAEESGPAFVTPIGIGTS